jgi:magnesium-dependent phosphatase 1
VLTDGELRQKSIKIAAASRTTTPELARDMLKLLHIPTKPVTPPLPSPVADLSAPPPAHPTHRALDAFDYLQIYPGSKLTHLERLGEASGLGFDEMLFFDDESRNREVEELGVVMWLVRDGMSNDEIDKGVLSWRKRNRRELH